MKITICNRLLTTMVNVLTERGKSVRCVMVPRGNDKMLLMAIGRLKKKYSLTDNDLVYDI